MEVVGGFHKFCGLNCVIVFLSHFDRFKKKNQIRLILIDIIEKKSRNS